MRRRLLTIIVVAIAIVFIIFLLLPAKIGIAGIIYVSAPAAAASRVAADTSGSQTWWPRSQTGMRSVDGFRFQVAAVSNNAIALKAEKEGKAWNISLQAVTVPGDQTGLVWQAESVATGWTGKPMNFLYGHRLRKTMRTLMDSLRNFLDDPDKVYGLHIVTGTTTDSFLISSVAGSGKYPSTADLYRRIDSLSDFARKQSARVTGFPMINVTRSDSPGFRIQAAVPIDRLISTKGSVFFSRRMVPGFFLISDVTGGDQSVVTGLTQMNHYLADEQRIQMAIPFFSLVTDRRTQPDSARWVTRIYLPVMK